MEKRGGRELIRELIFFGLSVVSIFMFWRNNLTVILLIIFILVVVLKFWHKKYDITFFIVGAIFGTIMEIICVYFGAWQYSNPTLLGIPLWLPFGWGLGTMLLKRIAETFIDVKMKN